MTPRPYTYTKLIQGHTIARNFTQNNIFKNAKRMTSDEVAWHNNLIDYLDDEIRRFNLLRLVCGDVTVIVR